MIHFNILRRTTTLNRVHSHFSFATTVKRSYYQILEIQPNFTLKQLRTKYLQKARKYHPDHNKSPEAGDQFKLLKQAYETLKDPQKRHMYDSGVSQMSDEVAPVYNQQAKTGRKYYQNKWYGYQRPKTGDMRDDYYKAKAEYFTQKPTNHLKYIATFSIIVIALFGYDILASLETEKKEHYQQVNSVLSNSVIDEQKLNKRQLMMRRYLQTRAEANKADL